MTRYTLRGHSRMEWDSKKTGKHCVAHALYCQTDVKADEGTACDKLIVYDAVWQRCPLKLGQVFATCTRDNFVTDIIPLA